jgi:two-component system OmpR family sensor kinase
VVGALLALFRSGGELQRAALDVRSLVARVPIAGLTVQVRGMEELHADPDLLSAALINLLDNSLRHGAGTVWIEVQRDALVVRDDGPGVLPARLQALRAALAGASVGAGVGAGAAGDAAAAPVAGAGAAQTPADAGAGSAGAGLGLGLLLAERAARAHGGWLELLESERGFAVRLVLAPAADGPRAMAA